MASYRDLVIDLAIAGPGAGVGSPGSPAREYPIAGDFLMVWGESPADGAGYLDIRLDDITAPIQRCRLGARIGGERPTPFRKLYIDWPAIAAKRMGILIGYDCAYVVGDDGMWSSLVGTTNPALGSFRNILPANPAVNVDLDYVLGASERFELISMSLVFTASAVAANRVVQIGMSASAFAAGTGFWGVQGTANHTASTAIRYNAGQAADQFSGVSLQRHFPLPVGLVLLPGWHVGTAINNIQVGDQISSVSMLVRDF